MPCNKEYNTAMTLAVTINAAALYGISFFITSVLIPLPNQTTVSSTEEKHLVCGTTSLLLGALPAALIAHCITTRRPNPRPLCTTTIGAILSNATLAAAATLVAASLTGLLDKKNNDIGIALAIAAGFSAVAGATYGYISAKVYSTCRIRKSLGAVSKISATTLAKAIEEFKRNERNRAQSEGSSSVASLSITMGEPTRNQPLLGTTGTRYGTSV